MKCNVETCDNEATYECPKCNGAWCDGCAEIADVPYIGEHRAHYAICPVCDSVVERIDDE
jgi:C4-type Zn-finger protein